MNWRAEKEFLRRKYKQDKSVSIKDLRALEEASRRALEEFEFRRFLKGLGIKMLRRENRKINKK